MGTPQLVAATSLSKSRAARRRAQNMNAIQQRRSGFARSQAMRRQDNGGNARQRYEWYLVRAREAQLAGDAVEMESYYQHAEHYFRVMRGEDHERRGHL
jgi:Domain of unknown function (DUF4167)